MFTARLLGGLLALGLAVVAAAVVAGEVGGVPMGVLFRDAAVARTILDDDGAAAWATSSYAGALSLLTIVVWGSVASLSLFVAWARRAWWLVGTAALTAAMGADDALMLHERVGPRLGVPEPVFPAVYAVAAALLLWSLWRRRAVGPAAALLVGLVVLGGSEAVDLLDQVVLHMTGGWLIVVEDGAKLLGALAWVAVPVSAYVHAGVVAGAAVR